MTVTQTRIRQARSRCSLATVHRINAQLTARQIRAFRERLRGAR